MQSLLKARQVAIHMTLGVMVIAAEERLGHRMRSSRSNAVNTIQSCLAGLVLAR